MYTDGKWAYEKMFNIFNHYKMQIKTIKKDITD